LRSYDLVPRPFPPSPHLPSVSLTGDAPTSYASVAIGSVSLHKYQQGAYKEKMNVKKLGGDTQPIVTDDRWQGAYKYMAVPRGSA
jgi:hypothetical protein